MFRHSKKKKFKVLQALHQIVRKGVLWKNKALHTSEVAIFAQQYASKKRIKMCLNKMMFALPSL